MMQKILFFTKYTRRGPSSRYRTLQYLPFLNAHGVVCRIQTLLSDHYLEGRFSGRGWSVSAVLMAYWQRLKTLVHSHRNELIWIEYELFPYLPAWVERLLVLSGRRYVVDFDDALFHQYDQHSSRIVRLLLGRKIAEVMRLAEAVIVGNEYLADYARRAGARRIEIIPTVIDLSRYPSPVPPDQTGKTESLIIGWIGSPSTARYLAAIEAPLTEVCHSTGAQVYLIGAGNIEFTDLPAQLVDWDESTEISELQRLTVGIMPLPDSPWARGKCGLKLLQYMACGLPVVASPVGVNTALVEHGVNGFLASTPDEWRAALHRLLTDADLRRRMGATGRARVEREYSLQVTQLKLLSVFRGTSS
jgi:glycosyltransferase involved in cell wall biosynthesis